MPGHEVGAVAGKGGGVWHLRIRPTWRRRRELSKETKRSRLL